MKRPRLVHFVVLRQAAVQLQCVAARFFMQPVNVHRDDRHLVFRQCKMRVVRLRAVHIRFQFANDLVIRLVVMLRERAEQLFAHVGSLHKCRNVALLADARARKRQNFHKDRLLGSQFKGTAQILSLRRSFYINSILLRFADLQGFPIETEHIRFSCGNTLLQRFIERFFRAERKLLAQLTDQDDVRKAFQSVFLRQF